MWLTYEQGKTFKKIKANGTFMNLVNQFGVSKSTMVFKIAIVRFLNKYPKMKKSLLSFHFSNSFQAKVAFHIETCHLTCNANQVAGFYLKRNNGLKWVLKNKDIC